METAASRRGGNSADDVRGGDDTSRSGTSGDVRVRQAVVPATIALTAPKKAMAIMVAAVPAACARGGRGGNRGAQRERRV